MTSPARRPVHERTNREHAAEALQLAGAIERAGVPRAKAIAEAERQLGIVPRDQRTPDETAADDARLEKQIVADADRQLRALGFVVWNLSQPRPSKVACGIPDRLYTHPIRGVAVLWEAKSATGRQRPDQRQFQEHMAACGWPYVCGTDDALFDWLIARGIAARTVGDLLIALPYPRTDARPR